jgi:hypothetical protein
MIAAGPEQRVLKRIDDLAERWSFYSILTGAVVAGWITVAALMLIVALDMAFALGSAGRLVLVIAWGLVSIAAFLLLMVRPLRAMRTRAAMARRLEGIFPQLGSSLINSVQLTNERHTGSPALRTLALRQADLSAEKVALDTAPRQLTWRDRYRRHMHTPRDLFLALAVCGLLAVVGGACHLMFPAWPNAVYRLFHPTQFIPALGSARIVSVDPGDAELFSGSPLTIAAVLENPSAKQYDGELVIVADDNSERRLGLVPLEHNDRYAITLPKVTDPFTYRLEVGGTQTEHHRISIFDRPAVESISATYRYAQYLARAEETVELPDGTITVPQYTVVKLDIHTRDVVESAVVNVCGTDHPGSAMPSEPLARASFIATETGVYTIHLTDAHGYTNADPLPHRLVVTPDAPPRVSFTRPGPEITAAAGETLNVALAAGDDHGLSQVEFRSRLETGASDSARTEQTWTSFRYPQQARLTWSWTLPTQLPEGTVVLFRAMARDNRNATNGSETVSPQTVFSDVHRVRIVDREQHLAGRLQSLEAFRQELMRIYRRQTEARVAAVPLTVIQALDNEPQRTAAKLQTDQTEIRDATGKLAEGISPEQSVLLPFQSALNNLAKGRMQEAVDLAAGLPGIQVVEDWLRDSSQLVNVQDDILEVLGRLLEIARAETSRTIAQMENRPGGDLPNDVAGQLENLADRLKEFLDQQRRVIEASQDLAKKPVEDFTDEEKQLLGELSATEDDWSKFMNEQHSDFSKLPEQDFSDPSMLQELIEIATEIKMAEGALTEKTAEIAVPLEQLGAEMAEELTTHIEKWLPDTPDREQWSQEEPLTDDMREAPMAELPEELEDLVGDLMEDEEDLFSEMEDVSSSWADSIDKGAGWDAMDGPISNMSAQGVTGNRLPNESEIGGRSGEGRQGRSSGEFVGDSAVGKGGRRTPSRLSPDPFEAGQVKDTSHDPVGGGTGGGKESGQGGEGLEGPIPPPMQRELVRLADKQATLRNQAETIKLQFQIVNVNSDSLEELIKRMQLVEKQLRDGHFRSALRRRDVTLDAIDDARNQAADAAVRVDTSASVPEEIRKEILGGMDEPSPEGWEDLNRSYFERLATGK